ncbi:hypothetical protein CDD81_1933 [Ophiocordyceps australis]|uniref:F-box domain-containing protein n=1 Tax=Ophiocordyceps australis TaxID=1399860 RepID=A0A2C5XXW0_9HYPO|nr:hypothetical protein CDD81_1933 [Ophiocordyceps australis]
MAQPPLNPLLNLPVETIHRIADLLEPKSLGALRSTCRDLDTALFSKFAAKSMRKKTLSFTSGQVDSLVELSQSRGAGYVRKVEFYMMDFSDAQLGGEICMRMNFYIDQLGVAFGNLHGLETVTLRDHCSVNRSWTSPVAQERSGPDFLTVYRMTKSRPMATMPARAHKGYLDKCFSTLMDALSQAGARVKNIEVLLVGTQQLGDVAFSMLNHLKPSTVALVQGLERLHLTLDEREEQRAHLSSFLSHASNLKDLRINGGGRAMEESTIHKLLSWIACSPDTSSTGCFPEFPRFPRLETLSLGKMTLLENDVICLILNYASTLGTLQFWSLTLQDYRVDEHGELEDSDNEPSSWPSLCRRIAIMENLNLGKISIGKACENNVVQHPPGLWPVQVAPGADYFEHTGTGWREFLEQLAEDLEFGS